MERIFFSGSNQYVIMAPQTRQHKKKQIENSASLYAKNLLSRQAFYLHCPYGIGNLHFLGCSSLHQ